MKQQNKRHFYGDKLNKVLAAIIVNVVDCGCINPTQHNFFKPIFEYYKQN